MATFQEDRAVVRAPSASGEAPARPVQDGTRIRIRCRLRGTVQGVGLRPALFRLACALDLTGFVRNERDGVCIEIEGLPRHVRQFIQRVRGAAPPNAHLEAMDTVDVAPRGDREFQVVVATDANADRPGAASTPPDLAPCDACLKELKDPADRRYRYPFINCTACGPRFTIVESLPYERARTTMRTFRLCAACQHEYSDPKDRRFHAEATACPACGPLLSLVVNGQPVAGGDDALTRTAALLRQGAIVAVKGVGGFALTCDATQEAAVARLRQRKLRPHKPLAVMARDVSHVETIAFVDESARRSLLAPSRPIVLMPARPDGDIAANVAPMTSDIGVFLPPSPLQHLLLQDGPPLQVVTSGNLADEPIAIDDASALEQLSPVADAFLLHDRAIQARADDSVVRSTARRTIPIRRARGFVPDRIALPFRGPTALAVGAEQKNTVCGCVDGKALLSQHIGDLSNPDAYAAFLMVTDALWRSVPPAVIAHDLHPDFRSTRWARRAPVPTMGIQHHHAHVASCLVEHGEVGPAIGIVFDGTGFGPDGTLWGGEVFHADLIDYRRLGHLQPLALPGGDAAIREPWRIAVGALLEADEAPALLPSADARRIRQVEHLLASNAAVPISTGAGRWFDVVSAICGIRSAVTYDGQAAVELEAVAAPGAFPAYRFTINRRIGAPFIIDLVEMVRDVVSDLRCGMERAVVSARFHETMARVILESCRHARAVGSPSTVVLSGGCFQNRRLLERATALLESDGFLVLSHRTVPPNDGGISLGQAAVASYRLAAGMRPDKDGV